MLLQASYTSTGDHRGQVASKMDQKYRREGFREKGLDGGPSPGVEMGIFRKETCWMASGAIPTLLGTGGGCKTTV